MYGVLIIDGSLTVRMDLKEVFESAGYAATLCESAAAARRTVANAAFDLVVLDVLLPDCDGMDLLKEWRGNRATKTIPVMLLASEQEIRERITDPAAGPDVYVGKPYDRAQLIAQAGQLLQKHRASVLTSPDDAEPRPTGLVKILAVDDSPTYLHALATQLRLDGYEVFLAHSGEEALLQLAQGPVDGILLDLLMPGLSGDQTCRKIKASAAWRGIPVMMLTAREDREAMILSFNAGADDYIAKSSEFEVLRARLRAQLRRKQFENENGRIRELLYRQEVDALATRAHQEAQETHRILAQQWQETFDAISDGVCLIDPSQRILRANKAFADLLAKPLEQVIGLSLQESLPSDLGEIARTIFPRLLQTRQRQTAEMPAGDRWYRFNADPVETTRGAAPGGVLILSDITERKQAEQALAAANQAKDHFLAMLSHELRTPLTPVLMSVSALQTDQALSEDLRDDLEMIRRNIELEARLIDDLLDLTRIERNKVDLDLQAVDMLQILQHAAHICMPDVKAKGQTLTLDVQEGSYLLRADAARLQQILWNLLKNAIKFTPTGGTITVKCFKTQQPATLPTPQDAGQPESIGVAVEVHDTGMGIEAKALPRIFDAFEQADRSVTRRFGGLGLGLAISKKLVELHGGTISAESEGNGKGATFRVVLPAAALAGNDPAIAATPTIESAPTSTKGLRILLVEDHLDTLRIMTRLLTRQGHQVETAANVAAAISLTQRMEFDLLISDLGLPDGSGLDLMREIRKTLPLKAIALSGFGMEEDVRKSKEAGFMEHLTKPVDLKKLQDVIRRLTAPAA